MSIIVQQGALAFCEKRCPEKIKKEYRRRYFIWDIHTIIMPGEKQISAFFRNDLSQKIHC